MSPARRGRGSAGRGSAGARAYWSARVTRESDALDLEDGVFTLDDPREIARSLARSAERSGRRKAPPFRSAMSMLVFYVNRAGANLPARRRRVLERAKDELRRLYGRAPAERNAKRGTRRSRARSPRRSAYKSRRV